MSNEVMVKKEKVVLFEYMLAKRIKELRLSRNMTIEEVANRTGFTKGFVSKLAFRMEEN